MDYGLGTNLQYSRITNGLTCKGRALCPDGEVRAFRGTTADTFSTIPARVSLKGTTVTGFVTVQTAEGYDTATEDDPAVVKFIPYKYRKNHALFDDGAPYDADRPPGTSGSWGEA